MSNTIIEASNLRKEFRIAKHYQGTLGAFRSLFSREYKLVKAVDDINFTINQGELVGYLGPNGAGKSTTIKMLTGIIVPSGGSLRVGGLEPYKDRCKHVARLGVVFGQRTNLWWDLPVIESLQLLRHIYKVSENRYRTALLEFTKLLELDEFLHTPVRSLSLGQRMRADLAAALLHDPSILFLDEPTIGLDVVAKERVRQFVSHINKERGTTVILTTHDLEDVNRLCERVVMIDKGKLVFDGLLNTLVTSYGGPRQLVVELEKHYEDVEVAGATVLLREGMQVTYAVPADGLAQVMSALSIKLRWVDLSLKEPDVESTVRRIYENRDTLELGA